MEDKIQNTFVQVVAVDSQQEDKKPSLYCAVQVVSSWSLYYGVFYGAIVAVQMFGHITCDQSSWWTSCYFLKGAAADEATKIGFAMLSCSGAQSATAVLALLLACRRAGSCCQHLAFVSLAVTAANQGMMARIHGLFLSAYPWDPLLTVGIVLTIGAILMDLLGFLLLILGPADDE